MSERGDGAPPPLWYRLVLRLVVPVAFVIAWHFLVISGRWPHSIIPTPWEALESLGRLMVNGTIPRHATISLIRLLEGFALGSALGYVLAAAVTLFARMRLLLGGTLAFLAPVPVIAWIPVLIVSLGIDGAKVGLITIGTASLIYAYALTGFAETRLEHLEVARLFGKSRLQTFVSIVMPSSAYAVLGGMRVGARVILGVADCERAHRLFGRTRLVHLGLAQLLTP
jgi:sulfonate transport system permease protein